MADLLLLLRRCLVIRLTVDSVPCEFDWFHFVWDEMPSALPSTEHS